MALSRTAWQTAITATASTAQYTLGTLREFQNPTYGPQIWRYVQNKRGSSVTAGLGVMQEDGTDKYEVTVSGASTPNVRVLGAAQHTIADAYFGWVLADGVGLFVSDGTTTANTPQICAANGQFTDGTAVTSEGIVFANATEDPAGAGGTFQGYIRAL